MLRPSKDDKHIDLNQHGNPIMSLKTVKYYCWKQTLPEDPQLNDKLYLNRKGFQKIQRQTLKHYTAIVGLWLDNNSIHKIQGLQDNKFLKVLYLNDNAIQQIEGLTTLIHLTHLNLSHNKIQYVSGLENLPNLNTINLSKNFLTDENSIKGLTVKQCPLLTSIDLSKNQIQNSEQVLEVIVSLENINCLYLKGTPLSQSCKSFSKKIISRLHKLKFLDDRPILEKDHRLAAGKIFDYVAWKKGGFELEQIQKDKMNTQKYRLKQRQQQNTQKYEETKNVIQNLQIQTTQQKQITKCDQSQQIVSNTPEIQLINYQQKKQQYFVDFEQEKITSEVKKLLGYDPRDSNQKGIIEENISSKWKDKYEKLLQVLLLKYKFDFAQVQPSFNMIINNINKKMMNSSIRFEIQQLRKIWTTIEFRKRKQLNI